MLRPRLRLDASAWARRTALAAILATTGLAQAGDAKPSAAGPALDAAIARLPVDSERAVPILARGASDVDADGVPDATDNCTVVANAAQRDTDGDGIGNACDADLNNDCTVNVVDLGIFRSEFFGPGPDADFNGDGVVNVIDLGLLRGLFFFAPGPSADASACGTTLTISGQVVGATLPNSPVTVTLDGRGNGGGVLEFIGTTQADGSFTVEIIAPAESDMVTIGVRGTGARAVLGVESIAGSVARLLAKGGGDGTVDATDTPALIVSSVSSAVAILARDANGGPISDDDTLDDRIGAVDSALMIDTATIIDLYDSGTATLLPAGLGDTVTALAMPDVRSALITAFSVLLTPEDFDGRIVTLLELLRQPFDAGNLPPRISAMSTGQLGRNLALDAQFFVASAATFAQGDVAGDALWSIDGQGRLLLAPTPQPVIAELFSFVEDPLNPGNFIQVREIQILEDIVVDRLFDGEFADHVFVQRTIRRTFPDDPLIPESVFAAPADRNAVVAAFENAKPFPFSEASLVATSLVTDIYHRDNDAQQGNATSPRGRDTLDFNSDGTGSTRRRGLAFTWSVGGGDLQIIFSNNDVNEFDLLHFGEDGLPVLRGWANLIGTGRRLWSTDAVQRDESQGFGASQVENIRFRSRQATDSTPVDALIPFDYMISPGGTACRNPGSANSTWNYTLIDGRLDILRDFASDPNFKFFRTWEPVAETADGYHVIEMLQVSTDGVLVDPATTPGRANFYSREQDFGINLRPTLVDDAIAAIPGFGVVVFYAELTANDIDPEGDEIVVRDIDMFTSAGGTVTQLFTRPGFPIGIVYTPPPGFSGTDTLTYRASDLLCFSDPVLTGTVVFSVP